MVLIIDNYDSFTYNLVQLVGRLGHAHVVHRNDRIQTVDIHRLEPTHIIISPGPCTPLQAGVSNEIIRTFMGRAAILGVCLGHQCIGHVLGARIVRAERPMHGKVSRIEHDGRRLFEGLPNPLCAMRYHSLVVDERTLPPELVITARSDGGEIMGLRHRQLPLEGVQFHPESYRTPDGPAIMERFLEMRA